MYINTCITSTAFFFFTLHRETEEEWEVRGGGRAHSPAGEGAGQSQVGRLEKSVALCLLCGCGALMVTIGTAGIVFYRLRARDGYAGSDSLTQPFSPPLCYLQPPFSPSPLLLLTNYHPLSSLDCLH
jgi:hypothetical protein